MRRSLYMNWTFGHHVQTQVLNTQDQRFGGAALDPAPVVPLTDGEMKLVLLAPRQISLGIER